MTARGVAHDRLRDLLDDGETAAPSDRSGPRLSMAAAGFVVCLVLLLLVLIL